jgi:hypothetical protein
MPQHIHQENAHDAINTSLQKVAQQSKIKRQVCKIFFCEMLMYMLWHDRRLKCEKLTDDRRQVMAKAHIAFGKVS